MHRIIALSLTVFLTTITTSCVTPPPPRPGVLGADERGTIFAVRKGKDALGANRPEAAEAQFRVALAKEPLSTVILNDLGFSLERQQRYPEAIATYRRALAIEQRNVVARENLGRVLYTTGDVDGAIKELELVAEQLQTLSPERLREASGKVYSIADRRAMFRTLSIAYLRAGLEDEAICYSKLALAAGPTDFSQVALHGRLLLATGRIEGAVLYLRDVISVWQDNAPPNIFLDYGIATYSLGDIPESSKALGRLLARNGVDIEHRRIAELVHFLAERKSSPSSDLGALKTALTTEDDQFCGTSTANPDGYWPDAVTSDVQTLMQELCGNGIRNG